MESNFYAKSKLCEVCNDEIQKQSTFFLPLILLVINFLENAVIYRDRPATQFTSISVIIANSEPLLTTTPQNMLFADITQNEYRGMKRWLPISLLILTTQVFFQKM